MSKAKIDFDTDLMADNEVGIDMIFGFDSGPNSVSFFSNGQARMYTPGNKSIKRLCGVIRTKALQNQALVLPDPKGWTVTVWRNTNQNTSK